MHPTDGSLVFYLFAILASLIIGVAKAGVPGLGVLAVPIMAWLFGSKVSVGVILPLLIFADICAVFLYRKNAQWNKILGLFPSVGVGMIVAFYIYKLIPENFYSPLLGGLIIALLVFDFLKQRYKWEKLPENKIYIFIIGFLAGFATTMGNAAGPIMSIYLISCGLEKKEFMGTGAWYFLIINSLKVPYFFYVGSISSVSLSFNVLMFPAILVGVWLGATIFKKLNQKVFQWVVLTLAFLSALLLCFK